jgi:hypothetical protein
MFFYCFSCSNYMIFYPRSFRSILFYSVFYAHGIAAVVYIDVQWQWCTYYAFQRHSDPQGHMILCCAFDDALPGHPLLRSFMHSSPMPCSGITWKHRTMASWQEETTSTWGWDIETIHRYPLVELKCRPKHTSTHWAKWQPIQQTSTTPTVHTHTCTSCNIYNYIYISTYID